MSETPFRIMNEPLSFRDRAFIAMCTQLVSVQKVAKDRRSIGCDIQAAWDLAEAMTKWRETRTKE